MFVTFISLLFFFTYLNNFNQDKLEINEAKI